MTAEMLSDNRKRLHSCDSEDDRQLTPQTKRSRSGPCVPLPDLDSEVDSSGSDSSTGVRSPERAAEASSRRSSDSASPKPEDAAGSSGSHGLRGDGSGSGGASYQQINRILREAHFSSLQARGHPRCT